MFIVYLDAAIARWLLRRWSARWSPARCSNWYEPMLCPSISVPLRLLLRRMEIGMRDEVVMRWPPAAISSCERRKLSNVWCKLSVFRKLRSRAIYIFMHKEKSYGAGLPGTLTMTTTYPYAHCEFDHCRHARPCSRFAWRLICLGWRRLVRRLMFHTLSLVQG